MKKVDFLPVLLASDINVYSMARAFHEEYGVKSLVLARVARGPLNFSKILNIRVIEDLDETAVFMDTLKKLAKEYEGTQLVLVGCADHYVRLIVENKAELQKDFIVPYADKEVMDNIVLKETFYGLCDKYNLDIAKTFIYKPEIGEHFQLPFDFPIVVKPSCSVSYNKHSFPGQYKVYFLDNQKDLEETLKTIYSHGYDNSMIIQEFVPGDDSHMYDLQMYVGSDHKVKLMNMGNVLLEEHTPKGIGSDAATLVECHEDVMEKVKFLLEDIGYEGLADCDIKFDTRDNKFKIFEINIRQGRSHYRVTGGGDNLAKYIIDDYLYHKPIEEKIVKDDFFWHVVPLGVVYKYVKDEEKKKKIKKLVKEGKYCHSLYYDKDLSLARRFYLYVKGRQQYKNYETYLGDK